MRVAGPVLAAAVLAGLLSVAMLERARGGVRTEEADVGGSPATLYRPAVGAEHLPLVIVAHGFAGSRGFMDALARAVARAGFLVVSFDFDGHGRNPRPLSPDVTRITGTTAGLVAQTLAVTQAARRLPGAAQGPVSFIGHSMATDIVVRASDALPQGDVASVVALSMYSDAVTASAPRHLLVMSGQWEGRLRAVALAAARQVDPAAEEGVTVRAPGVERRADVAPHVGHVGVLYSPFAIAEVRDWILRRDGPGGQGAGPPPRTGIWIVTLLASLVAASGAASTLAGGRGGQAGGWVRRGPEGDGNARGPAAGGRGRRALAVASGAVLGAGVGMAGTFAVHGPLLGLAGFGGLAAFFAGWGLGSAAALWWMRAPGALRAEAPRAPRDAWVPVAGFALASAAAILTIDRYLSSFVPTGPRVGVFLLLVPACLPFALAEVRMAVAVRPVGRFVLHLALVLALAAAMALAPGRIALAFSAVPVTVLFLAVFGTMAGMAARRSGPFGALATGLALAVLLAWSLAASTPLFRAG